jgi:hypothetical protein
MLRGVAGAGAAVIAAVALAPAPAQSATYRYWSYWNGGDQWTYSSRGPAFTVTPADGVEGWRFVVSSKDGSQATAPATPSSYAQLCPGQPAAASGRKRVAVVIDYGPAGIAPVGESPGSLSTTCLSVPVAETGLQVLQRVARLRFHSSGLICGIAGYPATECPGQSAAEVTAPSTARATPTAVPTPAVSAAAPPPAVKAPESADPTASVSATPSTSASVAPSEVPSAVALALPDEPAPATEQQVPAWVAAIGATMIAVLLGLALAIRRGRS